MWGGGVEVPPCSVKMLEEKRTAKDVFLRDFNEPETEIRIHVLYVLPLSSGLGNRLFSYLYLPVIQSIEKSEPTLWCE